MSGTAAPARPGAPGTADALFAEARRRRRRRRLVGLAVVLVLAAGAVAFLVAGPDGAPAAPGTGGHRARPVSAPDAALAGSVAGSTTPGACTLVIWLPGPSRSSPEARPIRLFPWSRQVGGSTGPPRQVPAA